MRMSKTGGRDPSDSAVQREIEFIMLSLLSEQHPEWRRINWNTARIEISIPMVWRNTKPDGVWKADSGEIIIAEAYARLGALKSGHRRKVAMDALKLLALRESIPVEKRKFVRCLLVVPEELKARLEGNGWFPFALHLAGEVVPVALSRGDRERLGTACGLQGLGQARNRNASKGETE
jgi:hypothetical protein